MKNNIILIGMSGSGKSAVSKILSEKLELPLLDTDEFITSQEKMTVKEMTDKHGLDYFRHKESALLQSLQSRDNFILSAGDGIVLRDENIAQLHELGVIYYLFAHPETLARRLNNKTPLDDLKKMLKERKDRYEEAADHIIHTETISVKETADTILAYYLIANT